MLALLKSRRRALNSVARRIWLVCVFASLLPAALLGSSVIENTARTQDADLCKSYLHMLDNIANSVDYTLDYSFQSSLKQLSLNENIQTALNYGFGSMVQNANIIVTELGKVLQNVGPALENVMVCTVNPEYPIYGKYVTSLDTVENDSWYRTYVQTGANAFTRTKKTYMNEVGSPVLTLVTDIIGTDFNAPASYGKHIGLVKMDIRPDLLLENLLGYSSYTDSEPIIALFDENNSLLYCTNSSAPLSAYPEILEQARVHADESTPTYLPDHDMYMFSTALSIDGLHLMLFYSQSISFDSMLALLPSTLTVVLVMLLLILLFARMFTGQFSERLTQLLDKMQQAESGDFSVKETYLTGSDELSLIDTRLNRMLSRLEESVYVNYTLELEKLEAQLRALQLQINPHFLYNTLESLRVICLDGNPALVSRALEILASLFRYAVSHGNHDIVPFRQEIDQTENYVFIQKLRFPEMFEVFYDVPDELMDVHIPFFILQPILENAVLHGFYNCSRSGSIEVHAHMEDDHLIITVEDDGAGMDKETLNALRSHLNDFSFSGKQQHIGMKNVHQRLRLAYGPAYGLTITSSPRSGTRVTMALPCIQPDTKEGENDHVQDSDR